MIITRIIQYEGTEEWLKDQLDRSLNDGIKQLSLGTIAVLTIGNCPMESVFKIINEDVKDDNPS